MNRTALAVSLIAFLATPGGQTVGPDDNDYAGEVVGVIIDAKTQNPVVGAEVFFAGFQIGALTRGDGTYMINAVLEEGSYVLTLEHPCYLTVSVEVELSQAYEQPLIVNVGLPLKPRLASQRFSPPLGGPC